MLNYCLRRLLLLVPVFLAVSVVIFLIIHWVPGDPIDNMVQIGSSPEQKAALVARYGLDQPLLVQYGVWLRNLSLGDLGDAIILRRPVLELLKICHTACAWAAWPFCSQPSWASPPGPWRLCSKTAGLTAA